MAFDGIAISCITYELNNILTNGRVDKVLQPEYDEINLVVRAGGKNHRLILSASSSNPGIHFTSVQKENPEKADLLMLINELCDAGAEAISIHNERVISTTEIRCAGSTVSVNNTRCAQPFTIKVIGDPVNLENALLMRDGVYDTLTAWGLEIDIKKVISITIPAYTGTLNYKYAKPTEKTAE